MIKGIYIIRDILTDYKEQLYLFENDAEAIRWMKGLEDEPSLKNVIYDMEMYKLGFLNLKNGNIETLPAPEFIVRGEKNA